MEGKDKDYWGGTPLIILIFLVVLIFPHQKEVKAIKKIKANQGQLPHTNNTLLFFYKKL